jgi:hypothetical protein
MVKPDSRHHLTASGRLRLALRLLAATALLVGAAAFVYFRSLVPSLALVGALEGQQGGSARIAAMVVAGAAALVALGLLVELLRLFTGSGGRGLAESNSTLQTVLAIAIAVAINIYAFQHEADFDLTRDKQFTFPPDVVQELRKLKAETTIVVLQQHKTFGRLSEKPDRFDYAAERKVVEKVQDMVDRFRKLGPQFNVVVLDVEQDNFDDKLKKLTENNEKLRAAIEAAPENSILFASAGKVQRLSFNEFYQLDKAESKQAGNNLVLRPQGIDPFIARIVAIQEKRPRVALAVMHEWLTSESTDGQENYSLAGLRKSLTDYGFDVSDLVLKTKHRPREDFAGEAAALNLEENKLRKFEEDLKAAERRLNSANADFDKFNSYQARVDAVQDQPFAERVAVYKKVAVDAFEERLPADFDEQDEKDLLRVVKRQTAALKRQRDEGRKNRDQLAAEVASLRKQERAIEEIAVTDVEAKLTRLLEESDLLIIPRMTIINATIQSTLPFRIHEMDKIQADVIKKYMMAGKPTLVCAGPINDPDQNGKPPEFYDDLERLLSDRGITLGAQTILFDSESSAFRAQLAGKSFGGANIPPLSFEPYNLAKGKRPNPLGEVMLATRRSVDQDLSIKPRALRPIYVSPDVRGRLPYSPDFAWTSPESWNEQRPFFAVVPVITPDGRQGRAFYIPQFDADADPESKLGIRDRERRGPFPVAVAFEDVAPESWYSATDATIDAERQPSRIAVIGQGGVFTGKTLDPATERLLLNTCNWLVGRSDRLSRGEGETWRFPRVAMSESAKETWRWLTFAGLPALFVWLGLVVLMIRRVR